MVENDVNIHIRLKNQDTIIKDRMRGFLSWLECLEQMVYGELPTRNDSVACHAAGAGRCYVLTKENEHKPTIMVGCDTRISGDMLANALMAGACP